MKNDKSIWLARNLQSHDKVKKAERIGVALVRVERKNLQMQPTIVSVIASSRVTYDDVEPLVATEPKPDMIINIPKNALWDGVAIELLESEGIAFGKMYDLYRGLNEEDELSQYQNPEFYFTERMFDQNFNLSSRKRVSDRAYCLNMSNGNELIVVLSQDYELTADVVRTAYSIHSPFDILLKTNPFGRISTKGIEVAGELGVRVADSSNLYTTLLG